MTVQADDIQFGSRICCLKKNTLVFGYLGFLCIV
jgi:hypothetical protein